MVLSLWACSQVGRLHFDRRARVQCLRRWRRRGERMASSLARNDLAVRHACLALWSHLVGRTCRRRERRGEACELWSRARLHLGACLLRRVQAGLTRLRDEEWLRRGEMCGRVALSLLALHASCARALRRQLRAPLERAAEQTDAMYSCYRFFACLARLQLARLLRLARLNCRRLFAWSRWRRHAALEASLSSLLGSIHKRRAAGDHASRPVVRPSARQVAHCSPAYRLPFKPLENTDCQIEEICCKEDNGSSAPQGRSKQLGIPNSSPTNTSDCAYYLSARNAPLLSLLNSGQ